MARPKKKLTIEEPVKGVIEDSIEESKYRFTLNVNNKTLEEQGNTLSEAIDKMDFPLLYKSKIFLTFSNGIKEVNGCVTAPQIRRILNNKTRREIFIKVITLALK